MKKVFEIWIDDDSELESLLASIVTTERIMTVKTRTNINQLNLNKDDLANIDGVYIQKNEKARMLRRKKDDK